MNFQKENPVAAWQGAHFPDGTKFDAIADEIEERTKKLDRLETYRQFLKKALLKIFNCLERLF